MSIQALVFIIVLVVIGYHYWSKNSSTTSLSPFHATSLSCGCDCEVCKLRPVVARLFIDHAFWTREVIVAAIQGLPSLSAYLNRLLENQAAIANAVSARWEPMRAAIYDQQKRLWTEHIQLAVALVDALVKKKSIQQIQKDWYRNGEQIAESLSRLNPTQWPLATLRNMMKMHLDTLLAEVTTYLQKDWSADVQAQDAVMTHILSMADALTPGFVVMR